MTYEISEVSIHPFAHTEEGDCVNTAEYDEEELEVEGWNVHSFGGNSKNENDIIDDDDFPDFETAMAHAEKLSAKYGVSIDHRY